MFLKYLVQNISKFFQIWLVLTIFNQVVFFGACIHPYCILASIPHISLIALGIIYFNYSSEKKEYLNNGYNSFGYDEEGYNFEGYDSQGYDREGYTKKGFTKDGLNRNGQGWFIILFKSQDYINHINNLNKNAIISNIKYQQEKHKQEKNYEYIFKGRKTGVKASKKFLDELHTKY